MSLGLDIGGPIPGASWLDGVTDAIARCATVSEIIEVSAFLGHKFSVAHAKATAHPDTWRIVFRLLHERRDMILSELAAQAAQASGGATAAMASGQGDTPKCPSISTFP